MSCCTHCEEAGTFFNEKTAQKELKQYQQKGPLKSTRVLINQIRQLGIVDKTLIDVGGGIGAIQHELFKDGLKTATQVEASQAYIDTAETEAERLGHKDRLTSHYGDFVELAPELGKADVVTLDRVLCCYPDMGKLVSTAIDKTNEVCGLVYPRKGPLTKFGIGLANFYCWARNKYFRMYLHDRDSVNNLFESSGFRLHNTSTTFLWHVDVYLKG